MRWQTTTSACDYLLQLWFKESASSIDWTKSCCWMVGSQFFSSNWARMEIVVRSPKLERCLHHNQRRSDGLRTDIDISLTTLANRPRSWLSFSGQFLDNKFPIASTMGNLGAITFRLETKSNESTAEQRNYKHCKHMCGIFLHFCVC